MFDTYTVLLCIVTLLLLKYNQILNLHMESIYLSMT
jgi:hypothetical protein